MSEQDETPSTESKLTRTKEKWAREGKFLTGRAARPESERLPPGQHLVRDWPVLDLGIHPIIPREKWRLRITGLVDNPVELDWAAMLALPQSRFVSDIHCVTTWSRYDNHWDGVSTRDLIALAQPRPEAKFVLLRSRDGYVTNLALGDFTAEDALLAHGWDGQPISREHGGPVRVVVPHLYFWKSAKWVREIEFQSISQRD
jgi:DMSO/TMAO reductase YedYZ molybdopterin-dependent catalytic subunit